MRSPANPNDPNKPTTGSVTMGQGTPMKDVDPLDRDKEDPKASSAKSRLKSLGGGRSIAIVAVVLGGSFMIYKTIFSSNTKDKKVIVTNETTKTAPLAQQKAPTGPGDIMKKEKANQINPFLSKDGQGTSTDPFADPGLPPLDLGGRGRAVQALSKKVTGPALGVYDVVDASGRSIQGAVAVVNVQTGQTVAGTDGAVGIAINSSGQKLVDAVGHPIQATLVYKETVPQDPLQAPNLVGQSINITDSTMTLGGRSAVPPPQPQNVQQGKPSQSNTLPLSSQNVSGSGGISPPSVPYQGGNMQHAAPSGQAMQPAGSPGVRNINGVRMVDSSQLTPEDRKKITNIVLLGSGPQKKGKGRGAKEEAKKDIVIFDTSAITEQVSDSKDSVGGGQKSAVVHMPITVLKGYAIEAVMLTAINTQFPGEVTAIVTRDVYGATGTQLIIPKGSILHGNYNSSVKSGQSSLQITFDSVMRPQGDQYGISATAADQYGRPGIPGDVDNRFGANILNASLSTGLKLAIALVSQLLQSSFTAGNSASAPAQIVNSNGTFTTTGVYPLYYASQSAIQSLSDQSNGLLQGTDKLAPIITLPHGTKFKIILTVNFTVRPAKKINV